MVELLFFFSPSQKIDSLLNNKKRESENAWNVGYLLLDSNLWGQFALIAPGQLLPPGEDRSTISQSEAKRNKSLVSFQEHYRALLKHYPSTTRGK